MLELLLLVKSETPVVQSLATTFVVILPKETFAFSETALWDFLFKLLDFIVIYIPFIP